MRTRISMLLALGAVALLAAPEFTSDGQLKRPENYREWIYLSSGLGMTYGPNARPGPPNFDNVFVEPAAYRSFLQTGRWPEGAMFALEIRNSETKGSINKGGHYQGGVRLLEIAVKDTKRFADGWGYFGFAGSAQTGKLHGAAAGCNTCHNTNGAVENTFVQFYPTLLEVARQKGTLKPSYLAGETRE